MYFRLDHSEIIKQLDYLKRSYYELGQVSEILNRHYAVPILMQVTNMFFDLLVDSYLIASEIIKRLNIKKSNSLLITYSELMLICYTKVNFSSEENFMEYKSDFSSSFDMETYNGTANDDEVISVYQVGTSLRNICYEIIKLILLIFSMDKLAKCKTTTLDNLKR